MIRGDVGKREFIAFWLKEGRVLAGMNVNVWDVTEPIQQLIRSRAAGGPGGAGRPARAARTASSRTVGTWAARRLSAPAGTVSVPGPRRLHRVAGRINDEDVKAVRDAVPIDAVVSEYLQLRNAGGGNLKGLCPFHDEKSPSFQVSPSKGLFHCFGCQEGGDTIAFVMKVDHLSFSEAVERLAGQAGITLRYEEGGYNPGQPAGERIRLVEAHKVAAQFYVEQLATSAEAEIGRKFLAERGFDQAAAEHFGVGYSPARAGTTSPATCAARASPTRS